MSGGMPAMRACARKSSAWCDDMFFCWRTNDDDTPSSHFGLYIYNLISFLRPGISESETLEPQCGPPSATLSILRARSEGAAQIP